ncbi:hypothetical protein QFZ81_003966 [Paenibacillus sp. V4I9]|uniref:hypothetical protein n=1 Tax=Paenibacillus sp. V4I9 TaxID=3042308 RepID=UPI00278B3E2E|nr:hypothetical protein [Paenibacillus sp. V4I9]MDQ0888878.1 hypothetical protein [Paenibacillus sp. V4I9]
MKVKFGILFFVILITLSVYIANPMKIQPPQTNALQDSSPATNQEITNNIKNDFDLKLYSDKETYKSNEPIKVLANFKYIGNQEEVVISHGSDYITFSIKQLDGWFEWFGGDTLMPHISQLKKGINYRKEYVKSGGYSTDDPNRAFYEKFNKEKDLLLPKGTYKITANVSFNLADQLKVDNKDSNDVLGYGIKSGTDTFIQSELTINVLD